MIVEHANGEMEIIDGLAMLEDFDRERAYEKKKKSERKARKKRKAEALADLVDHSWIHEEDPDELHHHAEPAQLHPTA